VPSVRQRRQAENCLPCHPILVGCALIIPMIIQTILLDPSGTVRTEGPSNVSRPDPSGADQADAEHPTRNLTVEVRIRPRASQACMTSSVEEHMFKRQRDDGTRITDPTLVNDPDDVQPGR
jgi:hypothetical protein